MARFTASLLAALAFALAGFLAWNHPLSAAGALASVVLLTGFAAWLPGRWPLWTLALMPWIGLMPWTGWLTVEELDLVVLACAAGGYARWAWDGGPGAGAEHDPRCSAQVWWLLPLALTMALSAGVGVADAGGLQWGWWQGYHEPLNSLRLFKPVLAVALLLPLWRRGLHQGGLAAVDAVRAVQVGMVLMLTGVALSVWSERWAYTGLLNFSSDYRATGLFWEMHVGGAALDAVLAMGMPFALLAMLRAPDLRRWAWATLPLALGAYASVATFSRIVFAAVPLALALTWGLTNRQIGAVHAAARGAEGSRASPRVRAGLKAIIGLTVLLVLLAAWLFPAGGYRSLLALLGAAVLLLPLAGHVRPLPARAWGLGLLGGLVAAAAVAAITYWVPKGAYLVYTAAWVTTAALLSRVQTTGRGAGLLVGFGSVCAALVAVGVNWGGAAAWGAGLGAASALLLALVLAAATKREPWRTDLRWQLQTFGLMATLAGSVAVFGGGEYMVQRLTQSQEDRLGRQEHWHRALSWLSDADWVVGKGLGRFPFHYGLSGNPVDQVGDYRLARDDDGSGQRLVLTGGKHLRSYGDMLRMTQRIALPEAGPLTLALNVRTADKAELLVEVCAKHLLYSQGCVQGGARLAPTGADGQALRLDLQGSLPGPGSWFAPRWTVFDLALDTPGARVEIDHLDLRDGQGRPLLVNGDFGSGLARWYASSDRHHMPWHAKNLVVHLLFEQGLLGAVAWALAWAVALARVTVGAARDHALAPALAGALLGVLVVGLVDSLLDMPRVAWLLLLLLGLALSLPAHTARSGAKPGRPPPL